MKVVRFLDSKGQERLGKVTNPGVAQILKGDLFQGCDETDDQVEVRQVLAPVFPPNMFGIGKNYRDPSREENAPVPAYPDSFIKPTSTIVNPGEPIVIPAICSDELEVDYECELAVIIGRATKDVAESEALDCVAGYTVANELTARSLAKRCRTRGKSFDSFCPLGPVIATADDVPDPQNLQLTTTLNGVVVQDGNTADMQFSVAKIISYLSQDTTLLPDTIILTGTPPGTGHSRTPPLFLKPGDEVEVSIEKIGTLCNSVIGAVEATKAA